jgi:hypothetical protein
MPHAMPDTTATKASAARASFADGGRPSAFSTGVS